ncbi:hypothetical protein BC332_19683 [Capsicum chinense]|nr:hypothetical protein BC332_19683 [Capsicum chinense]
MVKTYSNYYEDDTDTVITAQEDYAQSVDVVLNEDAITNIIKEYCMPSGLPWHQVDEVLRNMKSINEINKLVAMLPTYPSDSKFFEETSRTDWTNLETNRDKITQRTQFLNEHPFEVEYVQDIMQQECDSLDCGVFVAGYVEYLREETNVSLDDFEAEYHQMRYATLLRKYGIQKLRKFMLVKMMTLQDQGQEIYEFRVKMK